jgi:multidrug transporter EmrE-like cation transporter
MFKYLLIVLGVCTSAAAQVFLKKASVFSFKDFSFYKILFIAGILYIIAAVLYVVVLKFFPISRIGPVLLSGTIALVVVAGVLIFGETIAIKQAIGLVFTIAAIVLLIA